MILTLSLLVLSMTQAEPSTMLVAGSPSSRHPLFSAPATSR
ncbi:MAG: hypothetical protein ABWY23_04950 [Mycetocola sp.]